MTIAPKLHQFLESKHADYDVITHAPTNSAMHSAEVCHIPVERMAKAVLLDTDEDYLLAVLPSDHRIRFGELRSDMGFKARLADEEELPTIFIDCETGAVPPVGSSYGVVTIVDESLREQPDIYFEAGDHASLIHMDQEEFARMMPNVAHGRFSEPLSDIR